MREVTETIGEIRALCKRSMTEDDFTYDHNDELAKYCAVLSAIPNVDSWVPLLFELIEEFDEDVDLTLGSPGPLVHTLEATAPKYEEYLIASLARMPTSIAVWMAARISRSPGEDEDFWQKKIKDVLDHPDTTDSVREFLDNV